MSSELDVDPALVADLLVRFLRAEAGKFGFSGAVLGLLHTNPCKQGKKQKSVLPKMGLLIARFYEGLGGIVFNCD